MKRGSAARGVQYLAFAGHLGLIAFSTAAMLTILAGPPQPWLLQEPHATVMRLGFRFAGPTYVALGAVAMLAFLVSRVGWPTALRFAGVATFFSLGVELLGTSVALPFGEYHYTPLLGPRVLGLVPFPIPVSWFYMLAACLTIVARLSVPRDDAVGRWRWAALAGAVLVAWDVAMDPAMVHSGHWIWGTGQVFRDAGLPGWLVEFFTRGVFYGMPLSNWLGWFVTGTLVARIMLAVVAPTRVAATIATSRFPILLYVANGIMPVALCFRDGLWWAAWGGALVMLLPASMALARRASTLPAVPLRPLPA